MTIEGQHAVITGAGRGIGRSISLALAAAGVEVVLASRTKSQLEAVALEIKTLGGIAHVVPTDVSDEIEVEDLAKIAVDACGTIEILV
ncbi:MAG: SDR family NAD(P)-dependent oxidoreductase, partial [Candidatus Latescibacteria bacterium]|nr:SDR family NAD(P)-dependent oxidoreductase [Candidatus Latescibacterota bacterium]